VSEIEAAARWYGALIAITWALAPLVRWLCAMLADRGVSVARPIAVLGAVYPAWLLASLGIAEFGAVPIAAFIIAAGLLGWVGLLRRHEIDRSWLRALLLTETASLVLFAAYIWLRGYSPQILGTEKPMDVAFLASSSRTVAMPPPDPWFAGEPINYYYLGYLLHGTIGRLADVPPETAFNLALATIFSTSAVAAFGVAWNVAHPWLGPRLAAACGLLAAFLLAIAGNLYAPWRLLQAPAETIAAWWWDSASGIGWRSSRIVCDGPRVGNLCSPPATETINEFPFFSFLLGDLHPHLMALPYTLVALALAWNLARRATSSDLLSETAWLARVAISGAIVGSLYALNTWDYPTFLLLLGAGVWAGAGGTLARAWKPILLGAAASLVAWAPFLVAYVPPTQGGLSGSWERLPIVPTMLGALGLHLGERTSIAEYVTIFGVPYAAGVALVLAGTSDSAGFESGRGLRIALMAGIVTILAGVLFSAPVIPLCGIPLALAVAELRQIGGVSPRTFALALFALVWALSIAVEIVYVRDAFDNRMNTLFKFYYQAWTLYAVAAAVAFGLLWVAARQAPPRLAVAGATVVALLAGAAYPVVASFQWTEEFATWRGLDGLAYGEATSPDDVAAIRWLGRYAAPGDVVLEAAGCSYLPFDGLPFSRVSAFTGVPTVIGWGNNHQRQWRAGQPDLIAAIPGREGEVAAMFADPDSPLVDEYGVDWLFVGSYEAGNWQAECPTAGPYESVNSAGYPGPRWEEAYRSGQTRIYRRVAG
jgi:YYY domain-containing protein